MLHCIYPIIQLRQCELVTACSGKGALHTLGELQKEWKSGYFTFWVQSLQFCFGHQWPKDSAVCKMWKGGHLLFNPFASDFNSVDVSDFFLFCGNWIRHWSKTASFIDCDSHWCFITDSHSCGMVLQSCSAIFICKIRNTFPGLKIGLSISFHITKHNWTNPVHADDYWLP